MTVLRITRAGPLTTIQNDGRFGLLRHGISASGPMDRGAFAVAGTLAGGGAGGIEFTAAGIELVVGSGSCVAGFAGGGFVARHNGRVVEWNGAITLDAGDTLAITPGAWGNYGYLRFDRSIAIEPVMGSIATNSRVALGGLEGRPMRAGDVLELGAPGQPRAPLPIPPLAEGPVRFTWGLHADVFSRELRSRFAEASFTVTTRMDRMGVRLDDPEQIFSGATALSLVSDAIVPGDIQILGDGTPIVLMRDHQPTGGYPRIATVISADLDRFAQLRPGTPVAFQPVSLEHAHAALRGGGT